MRICGPTRITKLRWIHDKTTINMCYSIHWPLQWSNIHLPSRSLSLPKKLVKLRKSSKNSQEDMVWEYNTTILTMVDLRTKTLSRQSMTQIKRLVFRSLRSLSKRKGRKEDQRPTRQGENRLATLCIKMAENLIHSPFAVRYSIRDEPSQPSPAQLECGISKASL